MLSTTTTSRGVVNKKRMHLCLVAEALSKQNTLKQRLAFFGRWKLFVVMKAVTALATSGAGGLARLPIASTSNGGGPIPLTLLIKAGKRVTIKKRVMSTTRIYSSPMHMSPKSPAVSSPCLGNLGVLPLPTTASIVGGNEPYVPSCYQNGNGGVGSSGASSAEHRASGDGLDGYGGYGVTTSPVSATDMTQAALIKEVQALRNTVEQQKRSIDMRDRYMNEILRVQDAEASSRDLERDQLMQQLRKKGSGKSAAMMAHAEQQQPLGGATTVTAPSTATVQQHHSSQTSPCEAMLLPATAAEGFADQQVVQYTALVAPVFPMPPPTSPTPNTGGGQSSASRGAYDGQRKRNSVDNASLARFAGGGGMQAPSSSRNKGEHKDAEDSSQSSSSGGNGNSSGNVSVAAGGGAKAMGGGGGGRRPSVVVGTKRSGGSCVASSVDVQGTAARDFVSLSISSIHKPPNVLTTAPEATTNGEQPTGSNSGTLTARGASTINQMTTSLSSSATSLPTSSRRVPALRGTSLLPHIPPNGNSAAPPPSKASPVATK